jgi:Ras and EF-hand domain-containing protein
MTAFVLGQERFRSMTKTYFRRADGVMLLYDVTSERSFLNVRQWVQSIDVSKALFKI